MTGGELDRWSETCDDNTLEPNAFGGVLLRRDHVACYGRGRRERPDQNEIIPDSHGEQGSTNLIRGLACRLARHAPVEGCLGLAIH